MVSGGMTCVKYLLFCFNLLFAISGISILVLGIVVQLRVNDQYSSFLYPSYHAVPNLLITFGVFIFVVAFFGCYGAVEENHCMIITFSVIIIINLILEVVGGIAGYVDRSEVGIMLEKKLNSTMYEYNTDELIRRSWDITQHEAECCGMNGPEDWQIINHNNTLPNTCCPDTMKDGSCTLNSPNVFKESCIGKLKSILIGYSSVIGAVGIGIAAFQLLGIIFACMLARHIRVEYETV